MPYGDLTLVWFVYIKSPLGTVLRHHKQAIVGIFTSYNDALKAMAKLRDRLSADLRIVKVSGGASEVYNLALLDPDLADVINLMRGKSDELFLILAVWN